MLLCHYFIVTLFIAFKVMSGLSENYCCEIADYLYQKNSFGMQDSLDYVGDELNKIGQSIKGFIKNNIEINAQYPSVIMRR